MTSELKLSDSELIERCLNGEIGSWETLVRRYQRLVASITYKFHLTSEDAADVFQSVCVILFQQLSNLKQQEKLSSWMITVTVRECWKLKRQQGNLDSLESEEWERLAEIADSSHLQLHEAILSIERQHLIRRAVELLADRCRKLIEQLFYREDPTPYAEIAARLKMPVASIGPTRARCLDKLKEELEKVGFF
ncbi:MAG: sigma-70 family RNA polymerase sigma factor [Blastocatellia bacterium]|nr:sigma-70 family RNA polymerase sigma factor [Blastocatellia bacterium]